MPTPRRALTATELLASLAATTLLTSLAVALLGSADDRNLAAKDADALRQIHQALTFHATDNENGHYAIPGLVDRGMDPRFRTHMPDRGPEDVTRNHSAAVYSILVVNHYVPVSTFVSPVEVNPWVRVKSDYDFTAYAPGRDSYWDPTFRMQIDRTDPGAHGSYAHRVLHGSRKTTEWTPTAPPETGILVSRGPKDGTDRGSAYHDSPTLRFFPPARAWTGHLVTNDNRVAMVTIPAGDRATATGGADDALRVTNPFLEPPREDEQPHQCTGGKRVVMGVYCAMAPDGGLRLYDPATFDNAEDPPSTRPEQP